MRVRQLYKSSPSVFGLAQVGLLDRMHEIDMRNRKIDPHLSFKWVSFLRMQRQYLETVWNEVRYRSKVTVDKRNHCPMIPETSPEGKRLPNLLAQSGDAGPTSSYTFSPKSSYENKLCDREDWYDRYSTFFVIVIFVIDRSRRIDLFFVIDDHENTITKIISVILAS